MAISILMDNSTVHIYNNTAGRVITFGGLVELFLTPANVTDWFNIGFSDSSLV